MEKEGNLKEVKPSFKCVFLAILFFACKQSDDVKTIVQTGEDGVVVSEISYVNDTLMHGLAKHYYKNGMLKEEINYDSSLVDGDHVRYYEDGKVKSRVKFRRGLREGLSEWYFPNGKVGKVINWMNNKRFGSSIFYYESGSIEAYNCFDFQEHNRYLIKFDTNG
ncbi:MAG: toxin-antitoxin system YwqK family antitoxin [Cyclobacteriaceae bacterium]